MRLDASVQRKPFLNSDEGFCREVCRHPRIVIQHAKRSGERFDVSRRNQQAALPVLDELRDGSDPARDNRATGGHRFGNGQSERLGPDRRVDEDVALTQQRGYIIPQTQKNNLSGNL